MNKTAVLRRRRQGKIEPPVITATVTPVLGALADGDQVQDALAASATQAGNYASSEGTIASVVATVTVDAGTESLTYVTNFGEQVSVSITVTDSEGNERVFSAGSQTVAGLAPTADTAPTITGTIQPGETVTINEGTYSGPPAPTITGTLTLDGVDVSGDMSGSTYTIPPGTVGEDLVWSETARNGIAPDATQSVTRTVNTEIITATVFPTLGPLTDGLPVRSALSTDALLESNYSSSATATVTPLLDTYPGAEVAYSLRRLSSSTTDVARVRRGSDDAERKFTALQVTDGTLETWVGAGNDGFVVTLYDQSGNLSHVSQDTAAEQPIIVSAGSLNTESGKPAMDFSGGRFLIKQTDDIDYSNNNINMFHVGRNDKTGSNTDRYVNASAFNVRKGHPAFIAFDGDGSKTPEPSDTTPGYSGYTLMSMIFNGSTAQTSFYAEGALDQSFILDGWSSFPGDWTGNISTSETGALVLGASSDGLNGWDGTKQEIIIYTTDQSANRSNIEQDIAGYYGITLA